MKVRNEYADHKIICIKGLSFTRSKIIEHFFIEPRSHSIRQPACSIMAISWPLFNFSALQFDPPLQNSLIKQISDARIYFSHIIRPASAIFYRRGHHTENDPIKASGSSENIFSPVRWRTEQRTNNHQVRELAQFHIPRHFYRSCSSFYYAMRMHRVCMCVHKHGAATPQKALRWFGRRCACTLGRLWAGDELKLCHAISAALP